MKKSKWILLLAAFIMPAFFVACSDDDEDKNYFKYDGETYELSHGMLVYYGQWWGDGYNFDLFLFSDGIQFSEEDMDFSGTGHGIFFELYGPSESNLSSGTYNYDPDDSGDPFTFYYADFVINYNIDTDAGTIVDIEGGTVKIERSGSSYKITIDAVAEDGKPVTGYFSGTLPQYDIEDFWKTEPVKQMRGF